jgi:hypothetical protein
LDAEINASRERALLTLEIAVVCDLRAKIVRFAICSPERVNR